MLPACRVYDQFHSSGKKIRQKHDATRWPARLRRHSFTHLANEDIATLLQH
ncbi:hypothetical protein CPter291_3069 [Collimonas pratensis]|uniref:Uncharacterized protein n=1 Tax=Collimonas pratensis TaxID=279113 RepID=A0ABM5Z8S3_9BURK|nr:hypothetical protein CPter291_3069 [Collimonas pratensis]